MVKSVHLTNRAVVAIKGNDRFEFLQGLVTNNIHQLRDSTESILYTAMLSPQGKFLYDFFVVNDDMQLLVDIHQDWADDFITQLNKYKLRRQVAIELAPEYAVGAVFDLQDDTLRTQIDRGYLFTDPRFLEMGIRCIVFREHLAAELNRVAEVSPHLEYDRHRLLLGLPEGPLDLVSDKTTVLEYGLQDLGAVSFDKGCYVGQELTARTHHRGVVRKRLFPLSFIDETPAWGTAITTASGEKIGSVRSTQDNRGIGMLRIVAAEAAMHRDQPLFCGNTIVQPRKPAWMRYTIPEALANPAP